MIVAGARRSLEGEDDCGDAFGWWRDEALWTICLVDGLGHGSSAAFAAGASLAYAEVNRSLPPDRMIAAIDAGVGNTRGAAIGVVQVDCGRRTLSYFGVGNVRAGLFGAVARRLEGTPGILGARCRAPRAETLSWRDGDVLVLWTDGCGGLMDLDDAERRLKGDPEALAWRLIERFSTGRDDAGVVCCLLEASVA